ncbi:MAG: HPr family phosphocarrier protein [Anaerolineales bacterium]|nr:HPr family phosphocarrier protein [Anaerolineales bacterium]MCL4258888.1 HPr family phosphocarrier protein [Anaerolineales bacterium]
MKAIELTIQNEVGLHARPATLFVKTAQKHEAEIIVSFDGKQVSAKSLLGLLTLAVTKGSVISVSADGADADAALAALSELVAGNFGE